MLKILIESTQVIEYSAVVLDAESQEILMDLDGIPPGWEKIAHHMTITMGTLAHKKGKI